MPKVSHKNKNEQTIEQKWIFHVFEHLVQKIPILVANDFSCLLRLSRNIDVQIHFD